MPITFPSHKELTKHTRRHWQEFNLAGENDHVGYLALAQGFCDGACPGDAEECERVCDHCFDRFREATGEFAVLMAGRTFILTFHILHPVGTPGVPANRTHPYNTNRLYYEADCLCQA